MRIEGLQIPLRDGTLAAWRMGAQRADAPVIVAVHGITATSRAWLAVARALGERAALVAVDLRGRGASAPLGPPFGFDVHVADLLALLDRLGLEAPVIAGHSLGAYVACRFAVTHPERVGRLVLVDGGVPPAGAAEIEDPDAVLAATLGPALARLRTTFANRRAYREWWRAHPAFEGSDVDPDLLGAYADYDLCGEPPQLRPSINADVVAADGREVLVSRDGNRLAAQAVLLHAPRGLDGAPPPLLAADQVAAWATARPDRRAVLVPDVNHYTIAMGERGARVVADEFVAALAEHDAGPALA
jgi:lipase